ncbi:ATPase associated with various cellular activities family protein [Mycobacterium kansasii]|uniref:ATPase associated with various cellular activities family protein n=1 Tax=Mycobacterium kansasii TaxID=1768 RepID=A0A1V3WIH4_MYCKA|nr:ATPase associated with various cellular activities family protein [Mycobacterium kansasii]
MPTDIIGTRIYRQGKEEFDTELGPVVVNFLLADEINRARPRCNRRCWR